MTRPLDMVTEPDHLWHYVIPSPTDRGRWLVVVRYPWVDRWTAVDDCPTREVAQREADRRNPITLPPPLRLHDKPRRQPQQPAAHDLHPSPSALQ